MNARALALVLLVAALTLPQATVPRAAALGDVTYVNGDIITASVWATNIAVATGATVRYAGNVELHATNSITINGRLQGDATSSSAFDLLLDAGSSVTVLGSVVSGAGASGSAASGGTTVNGGAGGDGGDVTVAWGALGSLWIADGAYIQSGNGGKGGDANVSSDSVAPTEISATGGVGGRGGHITLAGAALTVSGTIRVGSGGSGGDASAWSGDSRGTTAQLYANATGGLGGNAGTLTLPSGYSIIAMHNAGQILGAVGGPGGRADSAVSAAAAGACGSNGFHSSNDYETGTGGDGCTGENRNVIGGDGGGGPTALSGGNGGTAQATGGTGGNGGTGAAGQISDVSCMTYPVGRSGGMGGTGGSAWAKGGRGGDGVINGGAGGSAQATGGNGGLGGVSGNGGRTPACGSALSICQAYPFSNCWSSGSLYCGHAGSQSQGGNAGAGAAAAGVGGNGLIRGPSGTATWSQGNAGSGAGTAGQYVAPCTHSGGHGHI